MKALFAVLGWTPGLMLALYSTCVGLPAGDVSQAYAHVKPTLVKVWAFDTHGVPTESGTGFVVKSDEKNSWIVTAEHVVDGAVSVRVDVSQELHDIPAMVVAKTTARRDIVLLKVPHGHLTTIQFAGQESISEGVPVATAGYFQDDEQIGTTGQLPQLIGPGTVSSLREGGDFIGVNLNLEPGLSGAPVFDPVTGHVVGVVDVRSSIGEGGYAVSAPQVVIVFLNDNQVQVAAAIPPIAPTAASGLPDITPSIDVALARVSASTSSAPPDLGNGLGVPTTDPGPMVPPGTGVLSPPDVNICFGRIPADLNAIITSCSALIAFSPPNRFLFDRRCKAYNASGNSTQAIADCSMALRLDPADQLALEHRAYAYNVEKKWDLAISDAGKALQVNPNLAKAYTVRGVAYEAKASPSHALEDYSAAERLDVNQTIYIRKASHLPVAHADPSPSEASAHPVDPYAGISPEERARLQNERAKMTPAEREQLDATLAHPKSASAPIPVQDKARPDGQDRTLQAAEERARLQAEQRQKPQAHTGVPGSPSLRTNLQTTHYISPYSASQQRAAAAARVQRSAISQQHATTQRITTTQHPQVHIPVATPHQ